MELIENCIGNLFSLPLSHQLKIQMPGCVHFNKIDALKTNIVRIRRFTDVNRPGIRGGCLV